MRSLVFGFTIFSRQVHCLVDKKINNYLNSIDNKFDVVIVGGGIVGCATARELKLTKPSLKIALIEKESKLAAHQSGHNSGVLHAGIYYQPGSLKAKLCVEGIDLAYAYLKKKGIPYKQCGKLIVAVDESELPRLDNLFERAQKNGCKQVEMIDSKRIQEIEPYCRGIKAIWSPYTGIVDWGFVTKSYAKDFENAGGKVFLNCLLTSIELKNDSKYVVQLKSDNEEKTLYSNYVITCAGLQSDRVAQMSGCSALPKIMPFRGEYLYLKHEKHYLIKTNIYPVPDPTLPFLGVHFTPTINGEVLLGPNAVLAFKREGYKYTDFSLSDFYESITYSGMRHLIKKYFFFGICETYRGLVKSAQVKQLQRFIPELQVSDVKHGQSGVRAQALDESGKLVDDFVFDDGEGPLAKHILHVRNAPSPGATSSLAIAKMVVNKAIDKFNL